MRTKAHRYAASASGTFAPNTEVLTVSGDFEGGFIVVTGDVTANVGAGGWIGAYVIIDGVQAPGNFANYQSGTTMTVTIAGTYRIPHGRHRIALKFGASGMPVAASCGANLSVAELNA